ncbi:MAG TPA: hypothetical protein H9717_09135 [Candidatus Eisenbergiella merdipullorum]|uniref:Uncharacterized protein n=1 Tax=Candidatus Eisenbergiella merdipullorum TaxID=2838553 RepID=A0A9D2L1E3_9FIRM|nr:hypothetical protein [Candidatus Eisenbergiella merdipullorum]
MKEATGKETARTDGAGRVVLCGANSYEQKYFFNPDFKMLPQSVQDELHIICVLFTEEVGGIFTILFEKDGGVTMETQASDEDYMYDEVSAGLLLGEIRRKRKELLESLSLYYRAAVLKEDVSDLLEEDL